jgi:hypothetical protein
MVGLLISSASIVLVGIFLDFDEPWTFLVSWEAEGWHLEGIVPSFLPG